MKKLFTILVAVLLTVNVFLPRQADAQAPEKMSYQAVIRNSSNALVTNTQIGMEINIRQGFTTGTIVYTETQTPTTNASGLVSIEIGGGAGFSTINWASDTYFIEIKTAVAAPLTTYTITGVSQLLSVPYALHAKTADSITGTITETDPIYAASQAANITASDITKLSNLSGTNTGDQDIAGIATNANAIAALQTEQTAQNAAIALNTAKVGVTPGTAAGQMQYWDGTAWVTIAPGNTGNVLTFINGVPTWLGTIGATDVYNPITGKIWMDRNLGASQVATSSTDAASYGYLFQWGRGADGHQISTSATTSTLSSTDVPGNGNFILTSTAPSDWRSPQNPNLWQGVNGINNPCPSGYRIPTDTELDAESASWGSQDAAGAFASPLKLPLVGFRNGMDGSLNYVGSRGYYWSSTIVGTNSRYFVVDSGFISINPNTRNYGFAVRCIKN